jgi:hypothetical protein
MVLAVVTLLAALVSAAPADVTGKWDGTLTAPREDGGTREDSALLILDQKGTVVTGTVGGSEDHQFAITSGKVEGNKVTLTANDPNGREFKLELTLENDKLDGTISSSELNGKIHTTKRKP